MARDIMHDVVVEALEKDGWLITHDPYRLKVGNKKAEIDLGAEKLIAAEREREKILVEVKSFLTSSAFYEFHAAIGQYGNYRRLLKLKQETRILYLAMPTDIYDQLLTDEFGALTIKEVDLKLLIYNPDQKQIEQWIK